MLLAAEIMGITPHDPCAFEQGILPRDALSRSERLTHRHRQEEQVVEFDVSMMCWRLDGQQKPFDWPIE
jgi:hypothetical protein